MKHFFPGIFMKIREKCVIKIKSNYRISKLIAKIDLKNYDFKTFLSCLPNLKNNIEKKNVYLLVC